MTIQGQMEAQRAAAQTMMMKVNAQAEADMRVKQAEVAFDIERIKAEVEAKAMLMEREFSYNIELAKAQGQALSAREEAREKEKAKRIGMQNTQQSKLIDQRKNNLPPISFESNEDSLDGFDLAEFEPR
jgi:DNA-dependent RNA polymerase auxiliary subunit epsilon